jgi:hypothetical protein
MQREIELWNAIQSYKARMRDLEEERTVLRAKEAFAWERLYNILEWKVSSSPLEEAKENIKGYYEH